MLVKDLMTSGVESFREDDSVLVVAQRMRDVKTSFVPICDRSGHPVGIVSEFDIVQNVCADDRLASRTTAGEVMERHPITCYDDDALGVAEELMNGHRKARILVLDRSQRLVGAVMLSDVLRVEDERRAIAVAREVVATDCLA